MYSVVFYTVHVVGRKQEVLHIQEYVLEAIYKAFTEQVGLYKYEPKLTCTVHFRIDNGNIYKNLIN